jgi:hypothetical protein
MEDEDDLRLRHIHEQYGAASEEAHRDLNRLAEMRDTSVVMRQGGWVKGYTRDACMRATLGEITPCEHLTTPQPMFHLAHTDSIVCRACLGSLLLRGFAFAGAENTTCDLCRRNVGNEGLYDCMAVFGPLTVVYWLCEPCRNSERDG